MTADESALTALLHKAQDARARRAPQEALAILQEARRQWGDHDRILFAMATVFSDLGMGEGAITLYRMLLAKRPSDTMLRNNLAAALDGAQQHEEARRIIDEAIALAPHDRALFITKALNAHHAGQTAEARETLQAILAHDPQHGIALLNLAEVVADEGCMDECLSYQRRAMKSLGPLPLLRFNMSQTLFKLGQLDEAWSLYEARFEDTPGQKPRSQPRATRLPRWDGRALPPEKKLLVWMEQGIGEEILYASLLAEAHALCPSLLVECAPRLLPLFARSFPFLTCVARHGDAKAVAGDYDAAFQIPAASLGGLFRKDLDSFTPHAGYLKADKEKTARLKARYKGAEGKPVIGLSWRSQKRLYGDPKSIPFSDIVAALTSTDAQFVSLQYGDIEKDITFAAQQGFSLLHDKDIDPLTSLDDSAAQIAACDAVLTVSNTTAHMAGALHIPAHVLVPAGTAAPHHWFYGQASSPWYPSLRLYWQDYTGHWGKALHHAVNGLLKV